MILCLRLSWVASPAPALGRRKSLLMSFNSRSLLRSSSGRAEVLRLTARALFCLTSALN
jgi:hypothetical protein